MLVYAVDGECDMDVEITVTDFDAFVHAPPDTQFLAYRMGGTERAPFPVTKHYLKNMRVVGSYMEPIR